MPRILVVEDDTDIAELIAHYLTGAGHTVERLTSGRDVLPRLRREPVDLVILDIMLPGLDGLRICDAMRADPATAAIPSARNTSRVWHALRSCSMPAQLSYRRYAMTSSNLAQKGSSISSTAKAFCLDRSSSLPPSATSIAFAHVWTRMRTISPR